MRNKKAQKNAVILAPAWEVNQMMSWSHMPLVRQSRLIFNRFPFLFMILFGLVYVPFLTGPARFFAMAEDDDYYVGDDVVAVDDVAVDDNEDDDYFDLSNANFEEVSLMPVSCVNYMNGYMIKFEFFESNGNLQCHTKNLGTFVVSISHYMRAYFNYQALIQGQNFRLPSDAGYLNCVQLQETTYANEKLYAKIGCLERETYTSTKLKIHVYTDAQCSQAYDDGQSEEKHVRRGYDINGYYFDTKVSFRPPFYSCMTCKPSQIAESFSRQGTYWYDDDAVANGMGRAKYDDFYMDDAMMDDYFTYDDTYYKIQEYINNQIENKKNDDDDFYTFDDDSRRLRVFKDLFRTFTPEKNTYEKFANEFWEHHDRQLEESDDDANDGDISDWNMCQRVYKYGVWCDEECRDIDTFRVDEWSASDLFLLIIMCAFMCAMMLLIFAKRVKAYEKASVYGEELNVNPGCPPMALALLFILLLVAVITLANFRFVNETLVFAVVTCILLFIYMLKLTLFETKTNTLLSSGKPRLEYNYGGNGLFS